MSTVDKIRNELIDKILAIKNPDFLEALNNLISSGDNDGKVIVLTDTQKEILKMSENDIKNGDLISQEAMDKRNREWLDEL